MRPEEQKSQFMRCTRSLMFNLLLLGALFPVSSARAQLFPFPGPVPQGGGAVCPGGTTTYTTLGIFNATVPAGCHHGTLTVWGAGGNGGVGDGTFFGPGGGGGGGGGQASAIFNVTPGDVYVVTVNASGGVNSIGHGSNSVVCASGGDGVDGSSGGGGGGGSIPAFSGSFSSPSSNSGSNGNSQVGSNGGSGGDGGGNPGSGGSGGGHSSNGGAGTAPGGGGGGDGSLVINNPGAGGKGQAQITWST